MLSEISRVASPSALIYVNEPCASIFLTEKMLRKADRATHIGISHKFYRLKDYIGILSKIISKIHVEGELMAVSKSNHPLLANVLLTISASHKKLVSLFPPLSTLLVRTELLLIGGSVELLGQKTIEYEREIDRDLVTIDNSRMNDSLIQFYREKFIPGVYQAFLDSHKKATSTRIELNAYN